MTIELTREGKITNPHLRNGLVNAPKRAHAVTQAIQLGAIGFDAVKLIALAQVGPRPARLDLAAYPHPTRTTVKTTCAANYGLLAA